MRNSQILIHIGYHKARSTWLQQVLFKDEKIFFAPWASQPGQVVVQFKIPNAYSFSPEATRRLFEAGLQKALRRGLVPVLSHVLSM